MKINEKLNNIFLLIERPLKNVRLQADSTFRSKCVLKIDPPDAEGSCNLE